MNFNAFLGFIITFIILNQTVFARVGHSKELNQPMRKIMCYDENRKPIYGDPEAQGYDPNCVYMAEAFKTLLALPADMLSTRQVNPDCKNTNICLAACKNSMCLSMGLTSNLFSYKATWTLRFVCFGSIYTGCVLAFMIIMYYSFRSRIHFIKYKTMLEEPVDDSDSGFDSEIEEGSGGLMKPSDSLSESFCSQSGMQSQKSVTSEKMTLPQKRKSNI